MSKKAKDILRETSHRPWEIPQGQWSYYQEWNEALFLHWKIPVEIIQELIPTGLTLDTFNGNAWVSVVAFTMEDIRPFALPSVSFVSDFYEINVRTYVVNNGKAGVYFVNIEAQKMLSVFLAKALSGLPYEKSDMRRAAGYYKSDNHYKGFSLEASYDEGETAYDLTPLDKWLVERYCLFVNNNDELYCYEIHHLPWEIRKVKLDKLQLNYKIGNLAIGSTSPDLTHYSPGVQVLAWKRIKLTT